jgi:saccharopine dehydrogenase-like NADP-dependent oxidoreductase
MKSVIVLGCGLVGRAMAIDLSKKFKVAVADIDENKLNEIRNFGIDTLKADLSDIQLIPKLIEPFDLVVGAVPGFMGFKVVESVIKAKKNIVDISFFPEDSLLLDKLAKENNVTAIVDCGVAPGMCNILLGYHYKQLQKVTDYLCYVGGLPFVRTFPFQYKAPFSPIDVIEEYTRPARYRDNSIIKQVDALTDPELLYFENIGTLEAFNTDGLRSLLQTLDVPNMKEKTMRYPNHIEYIKVLKESGFFSNEEIEIGNVKIKPIELTNKLLFEKWKLNPGEKEFTVMKVIISGFDQNGKKITYTYDLFDEYDQETGISSMSRTTGYTATAAVGLLAEGIYTKKGIIPPEFLGFETECYNYILNYLEERKIFYKKTIS